MSTEYGFITSGLGLKVYITPFTGLIATTISSKTVHFIFLREDKSAVLLLNNNTFFRFAADKLFLSVVN